MTSRTTAATQEKPAGFNVFRKPILGRTTKPAEETRKVIPYERLSKAESTGVKKLFEALVPYDKTVPIDEELIWEEGLPAFEAFLGEKKFKKLKRYFGIGFNPLCKNIADEKEVRIMIAELRTIENARFYLHGFKELLETFASRLEDAPETMDTITKAKVLRMYLVVFCSYYHFIEDFDFVPVPVKVEELVDGKKVEVSKVEIQTVINRQRAISNSSKTFYPEVLFELENLKFKKCGETNIFYEPILEEVMRLKKANKNTYKELMRFAELKYDQNGGFYSVNSTLIGQTYGSVRKLKLEVNYEPGMIPHEAFSFKSLISELFFTDFYTMYKVLKKYSIKELDQSEDTLEYIDGSRLASRPYICYKIIGDNCIAGQNEADRIIWLMNFCADKDLEMKGVEGKGNINVAHYLSAIEFATDMGYIEYQNSVFRDIEVAEMLLQKAEAQHFVEYRKNLLSKDELRGILGIDEEFEREHFPEKFVKEESSKTVEKTEVANHISEAVEVAMFEETVTEFAQESDVGESVTESVVSEGKETPTLEDSTQVTPFEAIVSFALANGYTASKEMVSSELVENVIISGNEATINKFATGEIDEETLKKRIGFEDEFALMYFNIKEIDANKIEAKLLDLKKSFAKKDSMQKSALLVKLYCYLVENEVKCGLKNKVVKRNKSLKPENLRNALEVK